MSFMEDSPYQPPAAPPLPAPREPGPIKVFGVFHLIFAGLGLITALWSIASTFMPPMFIPKDDPAYQLQIKLQQDMMGYTLASIIVILAIVTLLLISGIKLVRSRPDGIKWSAIYSWTSIATKLLTLVVTMIWILPITRSAMRETMEARKNDPTSRRMAAIIEPIIGISMVATPIISCTYPLLALYFLSRRNVKDWAEQRSQGAF